MALHTNRFKIVSRKSIYCIRSLAEACFEVSAEKVVSLPTPCEDSVLLVLNPGERLYFHGKVKISVKKGSVSIVGHIVSGGYQESSKKRKKSQIQSNIYYSLFSPFTSSALFVEHSSDAATRQGETPVLEGQTEYETADRQQVIDETLAAFDFPEEVAVIILRRLDNNNTNTSTVTNTPFTPPPTFLTNNQLRKSKDDEIDSFGIPDFYPLLNNNNSWTGLHIQQAWIDSFQALAKSQMIPVVLVCGSKNSGKSTYCRCLANSILNNFPDLMWLETDLGQPEFAAPGMVSLSTVQAPLFGAPFTHAVVPERSYFVGGISPTDPDLYLKCIYDLYRDFTSKDQSNNPSITSPVIINTHGWVKGQGKDVLLQLIRLIQPTHIMQVVATDEPKLSLASVSTNHYQPVIMDIPNKPNPNPIVTLGAPERRLQQLFSYFAKAKIHFKSSTSLLDYFKLYEVPWHSEKGSIRVCTSKHSDIAYSELLVALNGQLIGLAHDTADYKFKQDEEHQFVTQHQLPIMIPDYPSCYCMGLGIVYKIDPARKIFQILTSLAADEIEQVNTLLLGQLDAPTIFTLMTTPHGLIPYLSSHSKEDAVTGSALIGRKYVKRNFK